jgi:hypothetical protein
VCLGRLLQQWLSFYDHGKWLDLSFYCGMPLGWLALVSNHGIWLGFYTVVELNSPLSILSSQRKISSHLHGSMGYLIFGICFFIMGHYFFSFCSSS